MVRHHFLQCSLVVLRGLAKLQATEKNQSHYNTAKNALIARYNPLQDSICCLDHRFHIRPAFFYWIESGEYGVRKIIL